MYGIYPVPCDDTSIIALRSGLDTGMLWGRIRCPLIYVVHTDLMHVSDVSPYQKSIRKLWLTVYLQYVISSVPSSILSDILYERCMCNKCRPLFTRININTFLFADMICYIVTFAKFHHHEGWRATYPISTWSNLFKITLLKLSGGQQAAHQALAEPIWGHCWRMITCVERPTREG